jgi:hypothetical protein
MQWYFFENTGKIGLTFFKPNGTAFEMKANCVPVLIS